LPELHTTIEIPPDPPKRGPRPVGCRERTMRLGESMCEWNHTVVPTSDATPDSLIVHAADGLTVDQCLRRWLWLAGRCDGARP
jgi:hypothetical protein